MSYQVRVLIAEDNFLVGEMIQGVAEEAGCTVVGRATDGRQAVEMTTKLRPDVVLMDIKMPNLDGIDAAEIIQDRCPTPIVILTAYDTPEMLEEASAAGVGAFLAKPPKVRELNQAIVIARSRFGDLLSLRRTNDLLRRRTRELEEALAKIKTLRGLIPICASCKKIRSDRGYWQQLEQYLMEHSEADFTHGLCPECCKQMEIQVETDADSTDPGALPEDHDLNDPKGSPSPGRARDLFLCRLGKKPLFLIFSIISPASFLTVLL
jgi:AmiR/NasT family two-component response regulator